MSETFEEFAERIDTIRQEVGKVVVGQRDVLDMMMVSIFAGGHALLEGVPGTGKTLLVRSLAKTLSLDSNRIQFTPDMMPSDITGTNVFQVQQGTFNLVKGPIFTELLLADEINRTPPKTQSALLEAMQEKQVTLDGQQHQLSSCFTVFATQNPVEFEGTYPLPEAQRDRFLLWVKVNYPSEAEEDEILKRVHEGTNSEAEAFDAIEARLSREQIAEGRDLVRNVHADDGLLKYARNIVRETRKHDSVMVGAGPRAAVAFLMATKTWAALHGRDFITPDDFKSMSSSVLAHRLVLRAESEIEGIRPEEILEDVFERVEVPR